MTNSSQEAQNVYEELLKRAGEANPRPRLEPVKRLVSYLGEPQLTFPTIHVAGTNGKTSTARAIEVLLRAHGIKTGLFTSPHLVSFEERIQIDGENITANALESAWEEMQPALKIVDEQLQQEEQSPITFFEALAVLAFVAFADAPIEVAVVEVGMGGEWDATNIVDSKVSVFTPIGLDHTAMLGTNLETIAKTKSGIIKPHTAVVVSTQAEKVVTVLKQVARQSEATVYAFGEDFFLQNDIGAVGGRMFAASGISGKKYEQVLLPLYGRYQTENALTAIAAVEAYFGASRPISDEVLTEAFAVLTSPGRLETVSNNPLVLVDSAHNPHGAQQLIKAINEHFLWDELLLVLGVLNDKDSPGIVTELLPIASKIFTTTIASERSLESWQLFETITAQNPNIATEAFDETREALDEAYAWASEKEGRIVLVAGSVLLAGEALTIAKNEGWGNEKTNLN